MSLHAQLKTTPTDACQFYYERRGCQTLLRPESDDCRVLCSYGPVICPPRQK